MARKHPDTSDAEFHPALGHHVLLNLNMLAWANEYQGKPHGNSGITPLSSLVRGSYERSRG
jgi:hypothetical protein